MKLMIATAAAAITLAGAAFAESHAGSGDAEAGAKEFRKCKSCHMIVADDGTVVVKGGRTGPNLYGIIGRQAGAQDDFRYGESLVAAGEAGLVWDEETFSEYVPDPVGFLKDYLEDSNARAKMAKQRVKNIGDMYTYLVSVGPEM